jgi:16S rRNA C967 or C1407 C5-methylase (RsmB/RsmF family)/NOL1/NOP2/fmu family ribosome biogenesis protein
VSTIPKELLASLEGIEGFDRDAFVGAHESGEPVTSVRFNPMRLSPSWSMQESRLPLDVMVPWSSHGFYLGQRPSFTFDPLFHAGLYYVQEASSMFLEQALRQLLDLDQPLKILDLCAAPGGKSTHIQSLISPESLLVSNEVIRGRAPVLMDNILKWGAGNVVVTSNDPSAFQRIPGYFDVMVVDAPCSGSGLFRKDEAAIGSWSMNNVQLCSQRQQRILADALPALKEDGLLVYSTCSFSYEEDEAIADWLVKECVMESCGLHLEPEWNIITVHSRETGATGYRFFPDKTRGEGFFLACFKKKQEEETLRYRISKADLLPGKERAKVLPWLREGDRELIQEPSGIYALHPGMLEDYSLLRSKLHVVYQGTRLGELMKDKLVPAHALALSPLVGSEIPVNELSYEDAIRYLQRQEFSFAASGKGWQLVSYQGFNLGWVNVLVNRVNNYYPKEFRILKQSNDRFFEK